MLNWVRRRRKKTIALAGAVILLAAVLCVGKIADALADRHVRYVPEYEKIDLRAAVGQMGKQLTEEDYQLLFFQCGLGKDAVDVIFSRQHNSVLFFLQYQEDFFTAKTYACEQIGIITQEERLIKENDSLLRGYSIADVRDGDILITKATHSIGWRHGHAAIVTDAEQGETLEAVLWGKPTMIQRLSKWRTYPTFIQLRIKDEDIAKQAALYAKETLENINYSLLTGLLPRGDEKISNTQCAHLPWLAYKKFGLDLDSDGGWLVTPSDLANCSHLEIVQIYGVNPNEIWK